MVPNSVCIYKASCKIMLALIFYKPSGIIGKKNYQILICFFFTENYLTTKDYAIRQTTYVNVLEIVNIMTKHV